MRRTEHSVGEKRVFLGSLNKKNNLRVTYERLNLEEKAFISSTKFNRRQLLSRQSKLRHLQTQGKSGLSLETRPNTRTSFPHLNGGRESVIRSYSNDLSLPPYSRNGLRSSGEGKRLGSLLAKDGSAGIKQIKSDDINKHNSNASNNMLDFKDVSNEIKTPSKQKSAKVGKDLKSKQVQHSGLHVGDIIAYSARYGRREKPRRGVSSMDQEDVKTGGNEISEPTDDNKDFAVKKPTVWKNDPDSSASTEVNVFRDTTRSLENEDMNSTKHSEKNVLDPKDRSNNATSRERSPRVLSEKTTLEESATDEGESTVIPWLKHSNGQAFGETNTSFQANTNTQSDEMTSESQFITSSFENSQETDGPNVSRSSHEPNQPNVPITFNSPEDDCTEEQTERPSSSVPALVSRTPSWNGTKDLPALGKIRRGSFCDVKTFTSGKVLDLLSSCEFPSLADKKDTKQFLEVDNENLKYCRYLRSVTPEEAINEDSEALEIPVKYRPSKNIIIGHTKVHPM